MRAKDIKADRTTRYELDGFGLRNMTGVVLREMVDPDDGKRAWRVLARTSKGEQYEVTCTSREIIRKVSE